MNIKPTDPCVCGHLPTDHHGVALSNCTVSACTCTIFRPKADPMWQSGPFRAMNRNVASKRYTFSCPVCGYVFVTPERSAANVVITCECGYMGDPTTKPKKNNTPMMRDMCLCGHTGQVHAYAGKTPDQDGYCQVDSCGCQCFELRQSPETPIDPGTVVWMKRAHHNGLARGDMCILVARTPLQGRMFATLREANGTRTAVVPDNNTWFENIPTGKALDHHIEGLCQNMATRIVTGGRRVFEIDDVFGIVLEWSSTDQVLRVSAARGGDVQTFEADTSELSPGGVQDCVRRLYREAKDSRLTT